MAWSGMRHCRPPPWQPAVDKAPWPPCSTPLPRVLQATGFLIFISVRLLLAGRTILLTVSPMLRGVVRRGSSAQPGS